MANSEFSDIVLRLVSQFADDHVNTSMPAKVTGVDRLGTDQTIDVMPMINDSFNDGTNVEFPPIYDVPLIFPSAGGGLLSFPIAVGDTVLLIFSQKSLDEWMESRSFGNTGFTPADKRRYALNDAIAVAGLYTKHTNLTPNTKDVELKFKDLHLLLTASGDIQLNNGPAGSSAVLASSGEVKLSNGNGSMTLASSGLITLSNAGGNIILNLDGSVAFGNGAAITAAGDMVTATGKSMSNHTHSQGNDQAGDVQVNTSAPI